MKLTRNQLIFNAAFCLTLLGVIIWVLYAEYNRPWKKYQKEFGQNRGEKIQQLWLQDIGETDRCITCHLGADKPQFNKEKQPHKTHSGNHLKNHPVEKFGCVVCHEGQGAALTVEAAHGDVKNWTKPILKGDYTQSSCGKCHFMEQELPLSSELSGASKFIEGWRLFKEYSCIGCHKLGGHKRPERIGPVLTSIGSKVRKDWLVRWLKNPKDYLPKAKMPRFNLSDEESGYIADYLLSNGDVIPAKVGIQRKTLDSPVKPENDVTKPSAKQKKEGEILITSLGCLGCHTINNKGNDFAPAFTDIGNKVKPDWLYRFLKKPKAYDSKTIIPDFMLPDKEIPSIVTYLMSLKKDNPPLIPPLDKGGDRGVMHLSKRRSGGVKRDEGRFYENIEKGKKLVKDLGCSGCHEIEEFPSGYDAPPLDGIGSKRVDELTFGNLSNVEKTLINWLLIKVADPKRFATDKIVTRMPYYDFSKEQIEALVTFLLSIRNNSLPPKYMKTLIDPEKTEMRGKNIIEKYNCLGCHKINNSGRDIAPDLTNEGRKSRPEWLFNFLKNPYKIRPLPVLKARMPNFNLSEKEIDTIIKYLTSVSGESYPYSFEPKKEIYSEDIWNGEKLYQEIFACGGCHVVNGQGGEVGPEHTDLASRLKREWIEQWLKNPQAIQPDVRMPRFTFKDWEFEALTNYLMSLGRYRFVQVKHRD